MSSSPTRLVYEKESYLIRGACFDVYKVFRNTQKETVYQRSLEKALVRRGLKVEREKQLPVYFEEEKVGIYIPDILVNEIILLELKAKPMLLKNDTQQFWYYLKNTSSIVGFLINFGEPTGVNIIRRVNGFPHTENSV